jgi:flagellar motor switch protein FliM
MKAVLTQEQIDALIELVRAVNRNAELTSDLYDAAREHRAVDNIRAVFSQQEDNEV